MNKILRTLLFVSMISMTLESERLPKDEKPTNEALIPSALRKTAPDFTLVSDKGQPLVLFSYRGKVVLLDFWATWCGGCKEELPWYIEFDHAYRSKGLAVIGVSMDDGGMAVVKPFLASKHIDYAVVMGTEELGHRYGLGSMPMTLLLDKNGKIALSHTGVVNRTEFDSHIRELLKE